MSHSSAAAQQLRRRESQTNKNGMGTTLPQHRSLLATPMQQRPPANSGFAKGISGSMAGQQVAFASQQNLASQLGGGGNGMMPPSQPEPQTEMDLGKMTLPAFVLRLRAELDRRMGMTEYEVSRLIAAQNQALDDVAPAQSAAVDDELVMRVDDLEQKLAALKQTTDVSLPIIPSVKKASDGFKTEIAEIKRTISQIQTTLGTLCVSLGRNPDGSEVA